MGNLVRIENREHLISFRNTCKNAYLKEEKKVLVCAGTGCVASGSMQIYERLKALLTEKGITCRITLSDEADNTKNSIGLKKCGCHGFCEMGVLVRFEPQGWLYTKVKLEDCEDIVNETIVGGRLVERLVYKKDEKTYPRQDDIPFYHKQTRRVLEHCGHIDATKVYDYIAEDGYVAFEKALFDMNGDSIINEISLSGLRGRGGGGFPAGKKWLEVQRQTEKQKYVVCNGDEGDPGAFMDRSIMEGDPHRILEGMMIAGVAVGADTGYIYVRAEYPLAVDRLANAIKDLEKCGLLGENILGTGFNFKIKINKGAGAFVCGEGSALTTSIEGKRGMPRVKPPRTAVNGLFNKPTLLNNVETFANIPFIVARGAKWFNSLGAQGSSGTKAFALTGNIANTGLIEVPMGTTLREVIFDVGGGMRGNSEFKGVQIGGPSGGCLTEKDLDIPLDFDSLKKVGAMIGSGGLVVMDKSTCMVEVARFFMNFTQNESCGKCVPCREGTKRMLDILTRIVEGNGKEGDIQMLLDLAETISATALCALGKTAAQPVVSTIKNFRHEYEAHIRDKRCPAGGCSKLKTIKIDKDMCKGCSKCSKVCPVNAISGKVKEPFSINPAICIKCGACVGSCNFKAIKEE